MQGGTIFSTQTSVNIIRILPVEVCIHHATDERSPVVVEVSKAVPPGLFVMLESGAGHEFSRGNEYIHDTYNRQSFS